MMRQDLEKYRATDLEKQLVCYDGRELMIQNALQKDWSHAVAYDLFAILTKFPESYEISRNVSLAGLNNPRIGSHRGNDYKSKSIWSAWHDMPTIGSEQHIWGFEIDAHNERVLYNPSAMVGGRDSYFLNKNDFHTVHSPERIVEYILGRGYKLYSATTIWWGRVKPFIKDDVMAYIAWLNKIEAAFLESSGFDGKSAYMINGEITLADIENNNLPTWQCRPNHSSVEELIDILKVEHRTKK